MNLLWVLGWLLNLSLLRTGPMQQVGAADISHPRAGEAVSGVVPIDGTADHPSFASYELLFSYSPNPTGTWFPLSGPVEEPVFRGRLAIWDTSLISDGTYNIQLLVTLEDGTVASALVEGVRVRNRMPIETDTPPPPASTSIPTASPQAATPSPTPLTLARDSASGSVARAFLAGSAFSLAAIALLGVYSIARRSARARMGSLRMRHLYWQSDRRRRRQRKT